MEIIDNINLLLGNDLKQVLKPGSKLKVAASCFSIYAFEALKPGREFIGNRWNDVQLTREFKEKGRKS